jgi:hypothetical protein
MARVALAMGISHRNLIDGVAGDPPGLARPQRWAVRSFGGGHVGLSDLLQRCTCEIGLDGGVRQYGWIRSVACAWCLVFGGGHSMGLAVATMVRTMPTSEVLVRYLAKTILSHCGREYGAVGFV